MPQGFCGKPDRLWLPLLQVMQVEVGQEDRKYVECVVASTVLRVEDSGNPTSMLSTRCQTRTFCPQDARLPPRVNSSPNVRTSWL